MKKVRLQPTIIIVILLILRGVTFAEGTQWDVLSVVTRENSQGETAVNEKLVPLVQDVNRTVAGEFLRITMLDTLFDGRTLAAAWKLENLSDNQLIYLMTEKTDSSISWNDEYVGSGMDNFLQPGKTMNGGMKCGVYDQIDGTTMHVGICYYVLAPAADVAYVDFPIWQEEGIYNELIKQYDLSNNLVTQMDAMIATGKFTLLEKLAIEFDLQITEKTISFLPDNGPIEKEYEGFTMQIIQADYTSSTIQISIEAVFHDIETANRYAENESLSFIALNEDGKESWDNNFYFSYWYRPFAILRNEGIWVAEYRIVHRDLMTLPETLTIFPVYTTFGTELGGRFADEDLEGVPLIVR